MMYNFTGRYFQKTFLLIKRILRYIPVHCFLLAPTLIFFLFVHNYCSSSFLSTVRSYTIALLVSSSIFIFFFFICKRNWHKTGVVTTSLMLCFFFYGFIYELAEKLYYKGWWPFSGIHRYLLLLIFI